MKIFFTAFLGALLSLTVWTSKASANQNSTMSFREVLSLVTNVSEVLESPSEFLAVTEAQAKRNIRRRAKTRCENRDVPNVRQCVRNILDRVDVDRDGRRKLRDNCPTVANFEQNDNDDDSLGDSCDNCPVNSNGNQSDSDDDGVGNACDGDSAAPSV